MTNHGMNIFIVDENKQMVITLKQTLYKKFGKSINICSFYTGEECLRKVDKDTHLVILSYFLQGANGNEVLKSIKSINPTTEVIMLTANEDPAVIIESFKLGASDYVVKDKSALTKIVSYVYWAITEPLRRMGREFGLTKFSVIFISTFVLMAVAVLVILRAIPQ